MSKRISRLSALMAAFAFSGSALAGEYTFKKLVDSAKNGFAAGSIQCPAINERGTVAFKGTRTAPDGARWDVIALVDGAGKLTPLIDDQAQTQRRSLGDYVSLNNADQVSFAAIRSGESSLAIFRGDARGVSLVADTDGPFESFGLETQVNDDGEVAFTAVLDDGDRGLFSGGGKGFQTHLLASAPVLVDGRPAALSGGSLGRPSINNAGEIAFWDRIDADGQGGFAGKNGEFRTVGVPGPNRWFGDPSLNDVGVAAFQTSFQDSTTGGLVAAIARSNAGVLTHVATTKDGFGSFETSAPAINTSGQVVFEALLPLGKGNGIFTGKNPKRDLVVSTEQKVNGERLVRSSINFCAEGLNDAGAIVFTADVVDPTRPEGLRSVLYLAKPRR